MRERKQAYALFHAALAYEGEERRAYLETECQGNDTLRRAVEVLLRAEAEAEGFLEPAPGPMVPPNRLALSLPFRISHYEAEKLVGSGGMGTVYRARDLALGRRVALKVLHEATSPVFSSRHLAEANAFARVQHPAIATFYEAGDAAGHAFVSMEFVQGVTLGQKLLDTGTLSVDATLSMAASLLEALGHIHSARLVHGDIKPRNIMITDRGAVKLLDFGVARQLRMRAESEESREGTVIGESSLAESTVLFGTAGYSAPEQWRGDPVCPRSDIFALGAVLYECLSGRPAFPGATPLERISRVLASNAEPPPVEGAPGKFNQILLRSLSHDRRERYPSAAAILAALREVNRTAAVASLPHSLAVVDLANTTGNSEDDWIGSGMVESIGVDLDRVPDVKVVKRETVLRVVVAGRASPAGEDPVVIGHALGCRWVVTGAFRRVGSELHVTIDLTEVATGARITTMKLSGSMDQIFTFQTRIASAIAARLDVSIPPPPAPPRLDAYEHYARARRHFHRVAKGSLERAGENFERAVQLDAGHAAAYAGLAAVHALHFTFDTDPRHLEKARAYANRALEIDTSLGEAYVWLGYVRYRQAAYADAVALLDQALTLDPASLLADYFAGCALESAGRRTEARDRYRCALDVVPQNGWAWLGLGWTHLNLGNSSEALWCLERAADLERAGQAQTAGIDGYVAECLRRAGERSEGRARAFAGLDAVERSDFIYRDTFRGVCLCSLGKVSLELGDLPAAVAAFKQAVFHLRGRARALGGGHLLVQALCGLARAGEDSASYREARNLYEKQDAFSFHAFWGCTDDITLLELARAAAALGRAEEADTLLRRARDAGSIEPMDMTTL